MKKARANFYAGVEPLIERIKDQLRACSFTESVEMSNATLSAMTKRVATGRLRAKLSGVPVPSVAEVISSSEDTPVVRHDFVFFLFFFFLLLLLFFLVEYICQHTHIYIYISHSTQCCSEVPLT